MQRLAKGAYSPEFREQAIRLHLQETWPITESSNRLSLPKGTHQNWVVVARQGKPGEVG